ncbi:Gfo/Idh/MocA family protein [Parafrankia discariae]|uniref:Gfo/Idh/MocA family protein n=1 Tax=Parafrankia discariae TaxID=365528 RepID=UPI001E48E3E3|nr:Gfo/Idh/MocA family oxidoreductase [Parafrankia discariae]
MSAPPAGAVGSAGAVGARRVPVQSRGTVPQPQPQPQPSRSGSGSGARGAGTGAVRVAVVGLGWAGRSIWLPRLRDHPRFTVAAAVDLDVDARAAVAADGVDAPLLASPDLLRPDEIDLAVVAVPNHLHSAVGGQLLAAGLPVFLEKPVCLSGAQADELARAERAGGAALLAGSAARCRADVRALYTLARACGTIRHVELAWVRARGVPDAGGWFTDTARAGGGALLDLGWHLLDTVAPLVGTAAFTQVVGTVSADFVRSGVGGASWRHAGDPDSGRHEAARRRRGDVEDTARGFLVTETGVSVSLRASWASHEALDSTVIRVEGSAGTATLSCTFGFSPNRRDGSVLTYKRDGDTVRVPVPTEPVGAEYARQLDELPGLLADPGTRGRAVAEARRAVDAVERFYRSARSPAVVGGGPRSGGI